MPLKCTNNGTPTRHHYHNLIPPNKSRSFAPPPSRPYTLLYISGTRHEAVNIFCTHNYRITTSAPTLYKTYCFAFQKRRFCTVKAAVLHRKTYAFATPKRSYHFLTELSLQKHCVCLLFANNFLGKRKRQASQSVVSIFC